ncbi:MAG TPA: diguanylate cyclase [Steroidobacteraceae bacterium]|nr:diguanylate cyclase [Steroidobacteraceae bacterium]
MQGDSADLLRVFIDQAPAPIAMFDMEMRYIAASRRWVSDYHLEKREWRGASHYEVFTDLPDRWRGIHRRGLAGEVIDNAEDRFDRADGTVQWLRWEVRPWFRNDRQGGIIIFSEDITERKQAEERVLQLNAELEERVQERTAQLEQSIHQLEDALAAAEELRRELREQAIRDPLTGLFNRRFLEESMSFEVARAHRRHSSLGVLMLDMDRFKELNDNFGHLAGDSLLRAVAQALLSNIRAGDVACRFGGDEFIVLMPGADLDDVTRRGHQLCTLLNSLSLEYEHVQLPHPGCSMGVAVYPGNGVTGAELLRSVDLSLYRDKVHGHH